MSSNNNKIIAPWVDKKTIMFLCSLKPTFLRNLRNTKDWIEGVHYNYLNPKHPKGGIVYNSAICLDWMANRHDPEQHKKSIRLYCENLSKHSLVDSISNLEALPLEACRESVNKDNVA